jgi:hypothetical protein
LNLIRVVVPFFLTFLDLHSYYIFLKIFIPISFNRKSLKEYDTNCNSSLSKSLNAIRYNPNPLYPSKYNNAFPPSSSAIANDEGMFS